jgi:hypothetical protein
MEGLRWKAAKADAERVAQRVAQHMTRRVNGAGLALLAVVAAEG